MNIFFMIGGEIVTPALGGSILPGITRDSVLTLAKHWNVPVVERVITIDEVKESHKKGSLQEVFGSGTAAVISPVSHLACEDEVIVVGDGGIGVMAHRLYEAITLRIFSMAGSKIPLDG